MSADAPRILITRLSALGDILHTLPLAFAIKEKFPGATIAWLVQGAAAEFLREVSAIDHVVAVKRGWLESPSAVLTVRRQLQALRCEIALDPQSLMKSAVPAWLSGAKRRIGFARPQGRELAPWLATETVKPSSTHMVNRYLELLGPLGIHEPSVQFGVPDSWAAREKVDTFLREAHLGCPFVVLNPGAGWPSKRWPLDRFARVAKHLGQRLQVPAVVAWAGEEEREWADEIVADSGGYALVAPATSVIELAALLRRAKLCISGDTGPLHLAAAVGTRCLGMFGPTLPAACGPYGPGHVALQAFYQYGSARYRRQGPNVALRAISVEDVCSASEGLLADDRPRAAQRVA